MKSWQSSMSADDDYSLKQPDAEPESKVTSGDECC